MHFRQHKHTQIPCYLQEEERWEVYHQLLSQVANEKIGKSVAGVSPATRVEIWKEIVVDVVIASYVNYKHRACQELSKCCWAWDQSWQILPHCLLKQS